MMGPLIFTVGFIVQGVLRPEYDPISETISALEAGPYGWVQQLNFFVFSVSTMIFAAGLGAALRERRQIAVLIVAWWGFGLLMAGLFPLRDNVDGQTYDPTGLHQPNGALFFLSTWIGLAVLSWCLHANSDWRGLTRYTVTSSVALALFFVVLAVFAIPAAGPLHPWAGLLQRVHLAVWLPCIVVLATRLWRLSRSQSYTAIRDGSVSVA
jgi:hypothetical protein